VAGLGEDCANPVAIDRSSESAAAMDGTVLMCAFYNGDTSRSLQYLWRSTDGEFESAASPMSQKAWRSTLSH
jgi:hypothetical protein